MGGTASFIHPILLARRAYRNTFVPGLERRDKILGCRPANGLHIVSLVGRAGQRGQHHDARLYSFSFQYCWICSSVIGMGFCVLMFAPWADRMELLEVGEVVVGIF
jgi:hypothetical protein